MSIQEDIFELQSLDVEIKRLQKDLHHLRKQKGKCEHRVLEYLEKHNQPGVKFNGKTILSKEKLKRKPAKKQEKIQKGTHVLRKYGFDSVENAEQLLQELMDNMRGTPETVRTLKIS